MTQRAQKRRVFRPLLKVLGILLLLIFLLIIILLLPSTQTRIVKYYLSKNADQIGTRVELSRAFLKSRRTIHIDQLLVHGQMNDTLLYLENADIHIADFSLKKHFVRISSADLDGLRAELKRLKEGGYNYSFLFKDKRKTGTDDWLINLEKVNLKSSSFQYFDLRKEPVSDLTDWNYLDLDDLNARLSKVQIFRGAVQANVHSLSTRDKSGLEIVELESCFLLNNEEIDFSSLFLKTKYSYYKGSVNLSFSNFSDFEKVFSNVPMTFEADSAYFSEKDLKLIHPNLRSLRGDIIVSALVDGTLDNLRAKNVILSSSHGLSYSGRLDLRGLPKINRTLIDLHVADARFSAASLKRIIPELNLSEKLYKLGNIRFNGGFFGYIQDFVANGNLRTSLGIAKTDINLKLNDGKPTYSGILTTSDFNIGPLLGSKELGRINFDGSIKGSGVEIEDAKTSINGLFKSLEYGNYTYRNIEFNGSLSEKTFIGSLKADDQNANLDFAGTINLKSSVPSYNFVSKIRHLDLRELGFIEDSIVLEGNLKIDIKGRNTDDLTGIVHFEDFVLVRNHQEMAVERLDLNSTYSEVKGKTISIRSDLIDADLSGSFKLTSLESAFQNYLSIHLPHYFEEVDYKDQQNITFSLSIRKGQPLFNIFGYEDLRMESGSIYGYFNDGNGDMDLSFQTQDLEYQNYQLIDVLLKSKGKSDNLDLTLSAAGFYLEDSLLAEGISYQAEMQNQEVSFSAIAENEKYSADFDVSGLADLDTNVMNLSFLDNSYIRIQDVPWYIDSEGRISYLDNGFNFEEFRLNYRDHLFYLAGRASESDQDSIALVLNNFDLKQLNPWMQQYKTEFGGDAFVELNARGLLGTPKFSADFESCDFSIDGSLLGDVEMHTRFSESLNEMTIDASIQDVNLPATDDEGNPLILSNPLLANGVVSFGNGSPELDIDILLQRSPIDLLNKLLNPIIDDISGQASAKLKLYGSLELPLLNGSAVLDTAVLKVPYLNTVYSISPKDSNTIRFTDYSIDFNSLSFYDAMGTKGIMKGSIYHDYFKSTVTDLRLEAPNPLQVLNTGPANNSLYYGKANATGYAEFLGPTNNMDIIIYAKSAGKSLLELPLDLDDYSSGSSFVRFVNPADSAQVDEEEVKLYPYQLDMNLELTPETQVNIVFDRVAGDIITGSGNGNLKMKVDRFGDFKMTGDYTISSGDYLFTYENLINKRFVIDPGGKLVWDGNPYNARMDLTAVYKLRASPKDLLNYGVSDTSNLDSRTSRRLPVELKMLLGGTLLRPDIAFDISMPSINEEDLTDPIALGLREINSLPEKQNMQVFGLLMLGRFIQPESGISFQSAGVNSLSELLSNQFSNLISQYTGNLNVGIRYSDNDFLEENGSLRGGELQVALNTSLFNDRVLIDGNFDVGNDYINRNVGTDFTVEYMITEDGSFRVKAFNKLDDRQIINNFQTNYRQGVGLSYRKEFDDVDELYKPFLKGIGTKIKRVFPKFGNWLERRDSNTTQKSN